VFGRRVRKTRSLLPLLLSSGLDALPPFCDGILSGPVRRNAFFFVSFPFRTRPLAPLGLPRPSSPLLRLFSPQSARNDAMTLQTLFDCSFFFPYFLLTVSPPPEWLFPEPPILLASFGLDSELSHFLLYAVLRPDVYFLFF